MNVSNDIRVNNERFRLIFFVAIIADHSFDGTRTGWAEGGIIAHHTMIHGAIDAFRYVTSSFEYAASVLMGFIHRGGDGRTFLDEVFPFRVEIDQGGDVRLPRLLLEVIEIVVSHLGGEVFISQSCEAVPKLVGEDDRGTFVVCRTTGVEVVHTASAIHIGVDQDEEGIGRDVPNGVANGFHIACREVAVDAKGIEAAV